MPISRHQRRNEVELLEIIQEVEKSKLSQKFGEGSIYCYVQTELRMTRAVASIYISVARSSKKFQLLQKALKEDALTVSVAHKIVGSLTLENARDLIEFASKHSCREIEKKVAGLSLDPIKKDKARYVSHGQVQLEITISEEAYQELCRVQTLESQRTKTTVSLTGAVTSSVKGYLLKNDPIQKANRAKLKLAKKIQLRETPLKHPNHLTHPKKEMYATSEAYAPDKCVSRETNSRVPLTAQQRHQLYEKTQGRCTHIDIHGKNCGVDRWIDIHHIRPVSHGGTNEAENLTHLCWQHHDLTHQLSLPIEGQVSWLRSPHTEYSVKILDKHLSLISI